MQKSMSEIQYWPVSSVAVGAGNACFGRRRFGSTRESNFTRVVSSTVRFYQRSTYK